MRFERAWPVLRLSRAKTSQLVCVSSARVEGSCWCFLDFALRRSDGNSTKTEQREYETEARERPGRLKPARLCAPGHPRSRASSRAK